MKGYLFMHILDWSKIKNGYQGFEDLAYLFVADKFKGPSGWVHSPYTKDNNRDAYTIILGYQPYATSKQQWWMEAKYSSKKEKISRYRLDATIVSAILEKNVTKIIFITNVNISSKTIIDIRSALAKAIGCQEVYFFSKYTLEYWLSQNPEILNTFFPDYVNDSQISLEPYFVTEELEYYSAPQHQLTFKEPLRCLYTNQRYYGHFSIFSNRRRTLSIATAKNLTGLEILSPKKLKIDKGENPLCIEFFIRKEFKNVKTNQADVISFLIGKKELVSKFNIIPEILHPHLEIAEQEEIKNKLINAIKIFFKNSIQQFHLLTGISGIGKSYLIDEFLTTNEIFNENVYYIDFVDNPLNNIEMIINSVLFILFPYIGPNDIDKPYIDKLISKMQFNNLLLEFIQYKTDFEKLESLIAGFNENSSIFPLHMSINRRILIFDDVNKLKENHLNFLCSIIREIYDKKLPIFILLCGQPHLLNDDFKQFLQTIYFKHYKFCLSAQSVFDAVSNVKALKLKPDKTTLEIIFPNLVELLAFITYLEEMNCEISTMNEFVVMCKLFQRTGIWEKSLFKVFQTMHKQNNDCFQLCANIYWSHTGLIFDMIPDKYIDGINQLLSQSLIKTNKEGCLIPFHDSYTKVFRNYYSWQDCNIWPNMKSEIDFLRDTVYFSIDREKLSSAVKQMEKLCNNQKFHTLFYILEGLFENTAHNIVKNRIGEQLFYRLYRLYALSVTNISKDKSGKALFEKIYQETIHSKDSELLLVCTSVTWELINSCYEWMDFDKSKFYSSELINTIEHLQHLNVLDSDKNKFIRYQNMLVIQTSIDSELDNVNVKDNFSNIYQTMVNYGFKERAATYKVRFAHTLLHRDIESAKQLMQESMEEIESMFDVNHKFYQWALTTVLFINLITGNEQADLKLLIEEHEKMKQNYFNDYRKRSIAIAAYYFSICQWNQGKQYLFENITINRELRPRQKAFYCETMALYELFSKNEQAALDYLTDAENIFSNLQEYKKIIIHNKKLILKNKFSIDKIQFCYNEYLQEDYFYLDPRCIY